MPTDEAGMGRVILPTLGIIDLNFESTRSVKTMEITRFNGEHRIFFNHFFFNTFTVSYINCVLNRLIKNR